MAGFDDALASSKKDPPRPRLIEPRAPRACRHRLRAKAALRARGAEFPFAAGPVTLSRPMRAVSGFGTFAGAFAIGLSGPLALAGRPPTLQTRADLAASAMDAELSWSEFDALVLDRHAMSEVGRGALRHLLRAKLLDRLAAESKLVIPDADIEKKWRELEHGVVASGEAENLDDYLAKKRVSRGTLREFLRLAIVQETLARRALAIPAGRPVNGEQQEMWLDEIVEQRGTQYLGPPWPAGVAARCGDLEISLADFLAHVKQQLASDDVLDDCYQALLAKRAKARMPDLSLDALERAIDAEIGRRRAVTESDARYKGLKLEQVLGAQGLTVKTLRRDPAVVVAALAYIWVDRAHGEAGLRQVYADERAQFDRQFGEAHDVSVIFLRGAKFTNDLNPRSFEDAERELSKLGAQAKTRADFERLARARSEDGATRDKGGSIGFVAPGDEQVPEPIRAAIFGGARIEGEHVAGPARLSNPSGVVLLWVGERRPAPGWDEMRGQVHNELRRRFIEECLQKKDVVTYLDRE